MALNIDLPVNPVAGLLSDAAGSSFPLTYTRNDSVTLRVRLMDRTITGDYVDSTANPVTITAAVGPVQGYPVRGFFQLSTTTGTSAQIAYNAATSAVASAVSAVAGNVTVEAWGSGGSAWLVTAATANTALSFSGVTVSLFPASQIRVSTLQAPASGVTAAQVVELCRTAAVSTSVFSTASTANVVTLSLLQDGSTTRNETYRLLIGSDAVGGFYSLSFDGNTSAAVSLGASSSQLQTALQAVSGLSGKVSVSELDGGGGHMISFVGTLGLTNITTALLLDIGGVQFATFRTGTLTMTGLNLEQLFIDAGANTATAMLEVQVQADGTPGTFIQQEITLRRDLVLP
jgi:hypothetical protein